MSLKGGNERVEEEKKMERSKLFSIPPSLLKTAALSPPLVALLQ